MDSVSFNKALLLETSQEVVVTKETLDYLDKLSPLNEAEVLPIEEHFAADRLYTGITLLDLVPFKLMLRASDSEAVATKNQAGTSDDDDDGIDSNSNFNSVDNAGSNSSSSFFSHEK